MAKESRVKKSLLNAKVNMISYMASLVIAFFTRKVFLNQLGAEFMGLTSTLNSLLGFLNLAELGVGAAIGYVLYKPILDEDRTKINEIISVLGYLYRCIGITILGIGIILSLFIPLIFPETSFSLGVIYVGFYAYLASSLLGYFANYKISLLGADQRSYIINGCFQLTTSTKVILQMILAIYVCSFYLYFAIELTFGIINSVILNRKIRQTYPWLESEIRLGKQLFKKYPDISKYVKQIFIHRIGGVVQGQITPVLIYSYVSLSVVAIYGNYTMLTQRIQGFVLGILDSASAGIGNMISEGDSQKIYKIYKELFTLRFFLPGVLTACFFYLSSSFISVWLGEKYVLPNVIVLLVSVHFFMSIARGTTDQFLFGYGLFYDVWAPLVEAGILVIVAIICGSLWGITGVLLGPVCSMFLIVYIWKPYFLYSKGLKRPFIQYWFLFFRNLIPLILSFGGTLYLIGFFEEIIEKERGWETWIIRASCFTLIMSSLSLVLASLLTPELRSFAKRVLRK